MSITVNQLFAPWQPVLLQIGTETECAVLSKLFKIASNFTEEEMQDVVELLDDKHYEDMKTMFTRLSNSLNNYVKQ